MQLEDRKLVEVCYSPSQYHLYANDFDIVVAIDVLRATSAICTAIENDIKVIPVSTVEEAMTFQNIPFYLQELLFDK